MDGLCSLVAQGFVESIGPARYLKIQRKHEEDPPPLRCHQKKRRMFSSYLGEEGDVAATNHDISFAYTALSSFLLR